MKKTVILLLLAILIFPLTAFEFEISSSLASPSYFPVLGDVVVPSLDVDIVRADFNKKFSNDFFITSQVSVGFPVFLRAGVGVGKDFRVGEKRAIRLSETLVLGNFLADFLLEFHSEITWHPYNRKGFFIGGGLTVSIPLSSLYGEIVLPVSFPIRAGYSFYWE